MLLMLTDVDNIYKNWGMDNQSSIGKITVSEISNMSFANGSMGPKVEAACDFVNASSGKAGIGTLKDALNIIEGKAGTLIF